MLTAHYLDRVPDDVVELYAEFELSVLEDIARRIAKMDYTTPTAQWQIKQLQEAGLVYERIIANVAKLTGMSEAEIKTTFESASVHSLRFDDAIYKGAELSPVPLAQSPAMIQIMNANIAKTSGELLNLTRTTANMGQSLFIRASSLAQMQVQSGAFDHKTAINNAVKMAAREGLMVQYPSGATRSIESAVRTNVLTGVSQTAHKLTEMRMDEFNTDIVETSAHAGAREGEGYKGHVNWQGKQFSRSGAKPGYPDFVTATGYGRVDGLGGANCRHSFYPVPVPTEPANTKAVLDSYKRDDVTFKNKTMSYYEATQKQRYIESMIRRWKREEKMMVAGKQDPARAAAKIKEWQEKAREFTKATGVQREYQREKIA